MAAFIDMQKHHHDEFMQVEQLRYQQEKEMLEHWMKAQVEMEERRQQLQREECQQTNMMFLQIMNRLFDSMTPSHSHQVTPHPPLHYSYRTRAETPPVYLEHDESTQVYRNI